MMIHELKTMPKYFEDVISGKKSFEVRRNDRDFRVGDFVCLNEYDPDSPATERDRYTGRSILFRISYVLESPEYNKEGYVVFGIESAEMGAHDAVPDCLDPELNNEQGDVGESEVMR